jgi:hypothetical protein
MGGCVTKVAHVDNVNDAQKDVVDSGLDRLTGYYVAGHDWPAMTNDFSIADIYAALDAVSDEAVEAARRTLNIPDRPESAQSDQQ